MKLSIKNGYLLIGFLAIANTSFAAPVAKDAYFSGKVYAGIFGGGGSLTNDIDVEQYGTAFYTEAAGGPLAVNAFGDVEKSSGTFVGAQLGYQAQDIYFGGRSQLSVAPAIELEGFYIFKRSLDGTLSNDTVGRLAEHNFDVTYPMNKNVFLANFVLNFNYSRFPVTPYVGVGIGTAIVDITGANAKQVSPLEAGVNHYNSNDSDTDTTFAGQVKAGLSYNITRAISVFAEYRWVYISETDFTFGSTVSPGHVATSSWQVDVDPQAYNFGDFGIRISI